MCGGTMMKTCAVYMIALMLMAMASLPGSAEAVENNETIQLEEVVVTATKTDETRRDVPNAVTTIDHYDIQESPARNLGDLLAGKAGIDWRNYGDFGAAAGEIHIRGMRGNATQVFVNGVSLNSPSLGLADINRIPLNNIERVEVVKGSGSLLYGSGAMGGTVNIITKGPDCDVTDLKVEAAFGTEDTAGVWFEQGMFLNDNFGYYLTAGRRETDGFRDNSDLTHNDVSLNLLFDKGDVLDVSLYGDYVDREYGRPGVRPPSGTEAFFVNGVQVYSSNAASLLDRGGDRDRHLVLNVKSAPVKWCNIKFRGDYTSMENYNYMRYYDAWGGSLTGTEYWTTNKVLGSEATMELKPLAKGSVLLGADYKDFEWSNDGVNLDGSGNEIPSSLSITDASIVSKGVFVEGQYRPFRYGKFLAGIRHEDHSTFGYEDVPRLGVIVNPGDNTVLKISHGKHFKAPTPNDLFWPDDGFKRGNPDLMPETGWHTDATVEQSCFDDRLFVALTYFHWDVNDKIQWGPDSSGVWTPNNLRTYEAHGAEASVEIGPFYNMTLNFDYTYTDAEEEDKAYTKQDYGWPPMIPPDFQYTWVTRRAAYTPDHQFRTQLAYWTESGLTAALVARYVGDRLWYRTETDEVYPNTKTVEYELDSYWTADIRIEQRFDEHWTFAFRGTNLFDNEYDTYFDIFYDNTGAGLVSTFPGAGRSFLASLSYEF